MIHFIYLIRTAIEAKNTISFERDFNLLKINFPESESIQEFNNINL